jgi:hypothetical protein
MKKDKDDGEGRSELLVSGTFGVLPSESLI